MQLRICKFALELRDPCQRTLIRSQAEWRIPPVLGSYAHRSPQSKGAILEDRGQSSNWLRGFLNMTIHLKANGINAAPFPQALDAPCNACGAREGEKKVMAAFGPRN